LELAAEASRFRKRNSSRRTASSSTAKQKNRLPTVNWRRDKKSSDTCKPSLLERPDQFKIAGKRTFTGTGSQGDGKAFTRPTSCARHALCQNPAATRARRQNEERGHAPAKTLPGYKSSKTATWWRCCMRCPTWRDSLGKIKAEFDVPEATVDDRTF